MRRINIAAPQFEYDAEDPEGFRSGMARLGKLLGGAVESGISVYELPPGQAICPYHYECGEEEWLLVLEGTPTLRHPEGSDRLEPWDVVFFEKGPTGAHGVRNETDRTVRVLMFSTVVIPSASVYPDSDKVGVWTGDPEIDMLVRRESKVDYFDGEA
ncbi:MAG: cupin domain-containing protein [Solirubrobacterales bacterium]